MTIDRPILECNPIKRRYKFILTKQCIHSKLIANFKNTYNEIYDHNHVCARLPSKSLQRRSVYDKNAII